MPKFPFSNGANFAARLRLARLQAVVADGIRSVPTASAKSGLGPARWRNTSSKPTLTQRNTRDNAPVRGG